MHLEAIPAASATGNDSRTAYAASPWPIGGVSAGRDAAAVRAVGAPTAPLRWIESLLEVMTQSGFLDEEAAAAYRASSGFLLGYLLLEVSARGVQTGPVEEPDVSPIDDLSRYPILQRLEPHLSFDAAAQDFEEPSNCSWTG
jgi:hypothetical protein